jgi:autotransporter-associated beta strand protein
MGGAIFVMDGGSLVLRGAITIAGNTVAAGTHGNSAHDGSAFGDGLFLNGTGHIRFNPGAGQTEHVFNAIDDEQGVVALLGYTPPVGFTPGNYALIKSGKGTLVLSADNFYSGGTVLKAGTLDVTGLAGTGGITFAGVAKLEIANSAILFGLGFPGKINFFGKHDVIDLTGLHFHAGAHASYQAAGGVLTVHSGSVTDELFLNSPLGTHFLAARDGHGGTKITLDPPPATAHAVTSLAGHDLSGEWAGDLSASSNHMSDFLFAA